MKTTIYELAMQKELESLSEQYRNISAASKRNALKESLPVAFNKQGFPMRVKTSYYSEDDFKKGETDGH